MFNTLSETKFKKRSLTGADRTKDNTVIREVLYFIFPFPFVFSLSLSLLFFFGGGGGREEEEAHRLTTSTAK